MREPSAISEINSRMTRLATEYGNLAEDDPRAEDIKNELSRLSLLRYELEKEAASAVHDQQLPRFHARFLTR